VAVFRPETLSFPEVIDTGSDPCTARLEPAAGEHLALPGHWLTRSPSPSRRPIGPAARAAAASALGCPPREVGPCIRSSQVMRRFGRNAAMSRQLPRGPTSKGPVRAMAEDTRFELVRGCPQHAFQLFVRGSVRVRRCPELRCSRSGSLR
jgi:hypothetical protein